MNTQQYRLYKYEGSFFPKSFNFFILTWSILMYLILLMGSVSLMCALSNYSYYAEGLYHDNILYPLLTISLVSVIVSTIWVIAEKITLSIKKDDFQNRLSKIYFIDENTNQFGMLTCDVEKMDLTIIPMDQNDSKLLSTYKLMNNAVALKRLHTVATQDINTKAIKKKDIFPTYNVVKSSKKSTVLNIYNSAQDYYSNIAPISQISISNKYHNYDELRKFLISTSLGGDK